MVPAAEMSIHQEIEHIVERALAGDVVTVVLGELVFFSTAADIHPGREVEGPRLPLEEAGRSREILWHPGAGGQGLWR